MTSGTAIIIGAGPAGLTAAIELQRQTGIKPILIEASNHVGGISRTVRYKGNRMDIGGHRFFSKSDRVMHWWLDLMPVEASCRTGRATRVSGPAARHSLQPRSPDPQTEDLGDAGASAQEPHLFLAPLLRLSHPPHGRHAQEDGNGSHRSRGRQLYALGVAAPARRDVRSKTSSSTASASSLYLTFFKSYTEKVWGVPCNEISAEWGAQRIKGLSLKGVVVHFLKKTFAP